MTQFLQTHGYGHTQALESKVGECWESFVKEVLFEFSFQYFWHCWLGDRKGIRPVKKLGVGLLVATIWLEFCTSYSSSCYYHLHHP